MIHNTHTKHLKINIFNNPMLKDSGNSFHCFQLKIKSVEEGDINILPYFQDSIFSIVENSIIEILDIRNQTIKEIRANSDSILYFANNTANIFII